MRKKRTLICAIVCALMMCFSSLPVNAAASNYVIGGWGTKNVGGYQVKVDQNNLYSRRRPSGKWKKLSTNCYAYTTNGSRIYFAKGKYNYASDRGDTSIYYGSINGGKMKRLFTLRKRAVDGLYLYRNNLYVEARGGKHGHYVGVYSLKTHKFRTIWNGELLAAYNGYGIMTTDTYKWTYPLYSRNLSTGKMKKLTTYCYGYAASGKYLYFTAFTKNTRAYQQPGTFVVKRALMNGNGTKNLTRKLYGRVYEVTSRYVEYENNGVTKRTYYK